MVRLREHARAQHANREDEGGAQSGPQSFFPRRPRTRSRLGAARYTDAASLLPTRIRRTAINCRQTLKRCINPTSRAGPAEAPVSAARAWANWKLEPNFFRRRGSLRSLTNVPRHVSYCVFRSNPVALDWIIQLTNSD